MTYKTHMGDDLMVANAARVSFAKYSEVLRATDAQLICYLGKHKHWTPFAHPQIQVHVKAPIPIARQCFKHKVGFVENEISRRYVDSEPTFYLPDVWRKRNPDKKQGSLDEIVELEYRVEWFYNHCVDYYTMLLRDGVCPEQARLVLPQAMYTEWIWTGSLFAFARFHGLRNAPDAQKEVKILAQQAGDNWTVVPNELGGSKTMKYYISRRPWGGISVHPMIFPEAEDDGYTFEEAKRAVIMHFTRVMEHWSKKTEEDITAPFTKVSEVMEGKYD